MTKKRKKNNDQAKTNTDLDIVPPGEDQYLLGWNDAEKLEKAKPGMGRTFSKLSHLFHEEYTKGFSAYMEKYAEPEKEKEKEAKEELTPEERQILEQFAEAINSVYNASLKNKPKK